MSKPDKQPSDSTAPILDNDIGLRIKAAREALKLSQTDVHNKTGLSRTVLINYEAGRHKPGAREIKLICDALHISPNFLIYGTEQPHQVNAGLAHTILAMGESAAIPVPIIAALLSKILGYDEKRLILELVETVIKAKSPDLLNDIKSIIDACPKPGDIDIEKAINQGLDADAAKRLLAVTKQNIADLPKK